MSDKIIVLDFGSQYNQLIARRIREFHVYSELHPHTMTLEEIKAMGDVKGIIFSGGPNSVYDEDAFRCDPAIFTSGIPILGICYGMQMTHYFNGGNVKACETKEYGRTEITADTACPLFKGLPQQQVVWMSHGDQVSELAPGFHAVASSDTCPFAASANDEKKIYTLQFHPEVRHSVYGNDILRNFVFEDINTEEMVLSSYTYEYVVIFKDKNYESLTFQTSRDTIQRLNREKEEVIQRSSELLSKGKESKHPLLISALVTSLIVLSISIIAIIGNSRNNLWQKEQLISNYERQFGILKDSVDKLQKEITRKNALEKNLRQELESVLKERTSMRNVLDSMKYVNQKIYYNYRYYGYNNSYSTDYGINPSYVYVDKINPPVSRKSPGNRNLVIKRVQVASNRTIVDLEYTNLEYSRGWISINHDTYITSDSGDKQRLMMTVGIPFSPQKRYLSFREKVTFRLIFPAISSNTSDFDLIEENSPWKFYGIRLWR